MIENYRRRSSKAFACLVAALALAPLAAGDVVVRHKPASASWYDADGTRGQRFEVGGYTLEYRFPRPDDADAEFVVGFFGEDVDEEWRLTSGFFRDVEAAGRLHLETYGDALTGLQTQDDLLLVYEHWGQTLAQVLDPADLVTLQRIEEGLRTHVGIEAIKARFSEMRMPELPPSVPQGCYGAMARLLAFATATATCWGSTPVTFGLHGAGCAMLTAATALAVIHAWEECDLSCPWCNYPVDPPDGDGSCDAGLPPCHGGCDLDPGDACSCTCPGQACCDWPDAP